MKTPNNDSLHQGSSISGPRAKSASRRSNIWPAEQRQNAKEIYNIFFNISFPVLSIYILIFFY